MRFWILAGLLAMVIAGAAGQEAAQRADAIDSDHDGLSDAQEQALLQQFLPHFMISRHDCSSQPAEFVPSLVNPVVARENGTIYGQAFPRAGDGQRVELHYYDLWRTDCGQRGHDLDAEHVSALLSRDDGGAWKAEYWYAAAHEDTLCDASQIARAKTLDAETHGPQLWISSGKHAAFLEKSICARGCGADKCGDGEPLANREVINLGEPSAAMNGVTWTGSGGWPLPEKMRRSDFGEARVARLERTSADDIAWANPGKRPAQAAILGGDAAIAGLGTGMRATDGALSSADAHTDAALNIAQGKTGNALARAYRGVKKALRGSARAVEGK
jgi:hypothetical protein